MNDPRQWTVNGHGTLYYLQVNGKKLWDLLDDNSFRLDEVPLVDLAILKECCRQIAIRAQRELDRRANVE